jgi:hypothetical protein
MDNSTTNAALALKGLSNGPGGISREQPGRGAVAGRCAEEAQAATAVLRGMSRAVLHLLEDGGRWRMPSGGALLSSSCHRTSRFPAPC